MPLLHQPGAHPGSHHRYGDATGSRRRRHPLFGTCPAPAADAHLSSSSSLAAPGPTLGYITIAYIFDWGTLHFSSKLGMLNWISHLVNAVAGAAALAWVVRSLALGCVASLGLSGLSGVTSQQRQQ